MTRHTDNYGYPFSELVLCIYPSNVHTHTAVNTHPEQWAAIYAAAPGGQLGVRCLAQGHLSHGVEGGESTGYSLPHLQFLPAWDSNSQPLDYESDSLTIRPRLPHIYYLCFIHVYECHIPARSKMTWSSRGRSEKLGILLAHSTRVNSCLSAAWQILVTGSFVWRRPDGKKDRERMRESIWVVTFSNNTKVSMYVYCANSLWININVFVLLSCLDCSLCMSQS